MSSASANSISNAPAPKKQKKSRTCCTALCSKSLVSKYDREEYIRTTLCELSLYCLYLGIICMITYAMTTTTAYYYSQAISDLFLDTRFGKLHKTFRTSTTVNDFWEYSESAMLNGLYGSDTNDPFEKAIIYENKLIGQARLRQLRVTEEPCPISEKFHMLFRSCYPSYKRSREETKFSYVLTSDAWKYKSEGRLRGTSYWGRLNTYSGAGAVVLLPNDKGEAKKVLEDLQENLWVTRATRAVFLDFVAHNANTNLFCIVKLVWEFPTTGGIVPSWSIRILKINRYATAYFIYILVLESFFMAFTLFYTIQELWEMCCRGCCEYWSDIWSYIDLSMLIISYVCIGFSIFRYFLLKESKLERIVKLQHGFIDLTWLAFWDKLYNNLIAVLVFFAWVKLFKYISFNRTMTQLSNTMSRCAKDIGGFAIMFFIIFFAFAQLGYLLFGATVEDFRTFYDTIFALLRLILGDFDFRAIEAANRVLGPIYYITYVFFVFFVLLNMFLAIINDTYSEVKSESKGHGAEFEISDYLKRGANRMCCKSSKLDVEGKVRLANTENIITNNQLRENFQKANYSDVEIEMFLTRYELDEERPIDVDEAENILGGLEGLHNNDGRGDVEVYNKNRSKSQNALTDQEISELQGRVGVLETSLTNVTRKIEALTNKLEILRMDRSAKAIHSKHY